ncbi:hydroxyisourate hydrolase [Kwoniella shandongensis]|uniref:5-hydroxyisourate hydrolase n=1 Tax=Kwoniella shandongensis TaxID=1734106 RepID=A0A5M6C2V0_9TREE|nr:hydroxyisourate hydrolase [Kwoniella shandongensis]KAA5529364.1 hydroxyisourate hydrolase [Kwoniella shandongensis]
MSRSPITCHVLDAALGKPAPGVKVSLDVLSLASQTASAVTPEDLPKTLASGVTNADGRCSDLLASETQLSPGVYKMTFFSGEYFESIGSNTFYPLVEITFTYADPKQHYHIPLLISPFSYTTYRGS